jgi:parvulin-like peptidyl-prolyl isomerase
MPLTVNGEVIDDAVIRNEEDELRPRLREAMPKEDPIVLESRTREWARENAIERVLLRQAAMSDGEPLEADELDRAVAQGRPTTAGDPACILPGGRDDFRMQVEAQLRLERFTARLTAKLVPPRNKEISEYYRKHRDEFFTPPLVRAAHIVKNVDEQTTDEAALEQIRGIRTELEQGADFAEVADRRSDCPGRGGDLGYFPRGQMVTEFDAVVFALEPGQVSDIFRTQFGYHIAKVYDRKPEGIRPLADVSGNIEALLFQQKKQRRIEQYIDSLRAKADIQQ